MAISRAANNTTTPTVGTPSTLTTTTAPTGGAVYKLRLDTVNLAAGDTVTVDIEVQALSGGTRRVLWSMPFTGAQLDPIKDSPYVEVIDGEAVNVTLLQSAGTARAFPWALLRVA